MAERASRRGSGTLMAPRFTWTRPPAWSPVRALNSVVLPDCAYPTNPAFIAFPRIRSAAARDVPHPCDPGGHRSMGREGEEPGEHRDGADGARHPDEVAQPVGGARLPPLLRSIPRVGHVVEPLQDRARVD